MLKERADVNQQKALIAELKILIHLGHHVNIVNLMGAVTKNIPQGELLVMVEYCKYGNLRNYLLRHRDKFINERDLYSRNPALLSESPPLDSNITCFTEVRFDSFMSSSGSGSTVFAVDNPNYRQRIQSILNTDPKASTSSHNAGQSMSCSSGSDGRYYCRVDSQEHVITTSDLLCFAFQSSCGMDYLASRKLIHRDLAARNVLLAEDKVVKICDFGLAKDCYKYENYVKKGDGPLPIKWMAIESIRDHVFTTKSDVWSFGILMWEFFTLGRNPYPGIEVDEEFYKKLSAGYRMERPDNCPEDVYHIMQDCWLANPDDRPGFNKISDTLGGLLETGVKQHYIDLNAPYLEMNSKMQNHNYLNMPENEYQSNPTRFYMNADASLYDQVPPLKRSVFDVPNTNEFLEAVPMVQLDTNKEKFQTFSNHQDNSSHPSDYLKMGDGFSS
ncbi:vascular endothelial growth factor receptor 3 [Nephila pilipes]|uniref:Vascular endothelial growth factor receptor 3 n=1 Tax=Nephila pilipes TaxID=299642 RepID=A0A8X6T1A6_NEPPI|nr:vascular endothelial growth factor receptor 3 [Nephila pilipes]